MVNFCEREFFADMCLGACAGCGGSCRIGNDVLYKGSGVGEVGFGPDRASRIGLICFLCERCQGVAHGKRAVGI